MLNKPRDIKSRVISDSVTSIRRINDIKVGQDAGVNICLHPTFTKTVVM